ncbi:helicase-associated domain-containing protein [Paenibacillus sp. Marseille-Q4541]|uniref:helicase-associated domain-containing protein n=1 Tax=Paenibacillus sp. Marseille-Q4541 TaxID=2831522 RepID=UPI0020187224|nr:helicase-associated domain-containing protein [Paenibacillus sp. Marseille-Q4541]
MNEVSTHNLDERPWSKDEDLLLQTAFLEFGGNPLQMERLASLLAGKLSGLELEIALFGLRKKGWINAAKKTWGEHIYFIPSLHLPFLTEHYVLPFFQGSPPLSSSSDIEVFVEAKPKIAGEILHLLSYIANQGVQLTAKGTIHKKTLGKIENLTVLTSADFKALKLSYSHPDLYPVHVAVLLDLVFSLGLARREEAEIILNEPYVSKWIQLNSHQMERYIYEAFMERYSVQESALQHFRYLLSLFSSQYAGQWLDVHQICLIFVQHGMCDEREYAELLSYAKGWTMLLAAFGYGDTGVCSASEDATFYRWTSPVFFIAEEAEQTEASDRLEKEITEPIIYVQPDFEVIVPPDASYQIRWLLEGCSDLIVRDQMTIYKLTRERLLEGAELGLTPSLVLEWLNRYSQGNVPENVFLALNQWGAELGRTSFAQVMLLRAESEQDADKIEAYPAWNGAIQRIGPLYFILEPEKMAEVRKRLTLMGLAPAKAVKGIDAEVRRYPAISLDRDSTAPFDDDLHRIKFYEEGRQGFVYTGRNLHYYESIPEDRELISLLPNKAEVPKMWLDEWREYHPSTAKQLVQQAIEWRTRMGVEIQGARQQFIPESIGKGEPWAVNGWLLTKDGNVAEKRTLVPIEWTNVILILP